MQSEVWRDIPGFAGRYQASSLGRVRSLDHEVRCGPGGVGTRLVRGRVLKPAPQPAGHLTVVLGRGNTRSVHTCVMRAHVGPPPTGHEVLHRDHNPANNSCENLVYGTRGENLKMDYAVGVRMVHENFIGARWRHRDAVVS